MATSELTRGGASADGGEQAFPTAGEWFVLHTKSRQEKALASDLAAMRVPHFLPLVREVRYYGGRRAKVDEPLFPGYLFLRGPVDDAYRADRTKRVARIIPVADQGRIDWELRNLFQAISNGAQLLPYTLLKKGTRAEVRSGPFRGLQGIVEDHAANGRLILQVAALGRAVSLEIDGSLLDPLP